MKTPRLLSLCCGEVIGVHEPILVIERKGARDCPTGSRVIDFEETVATGSHFCSVAPPQNSAADCRSGLREARSKKSRSARGGPARWLGLRGTRNGAVSCWPAS